jgi:DNA anti-recombination protein RmuC
LQINKKFEKGTGKKVDTNWFKKIGSKIAKNLGQNFAGTKQTPNSQMDEIRKRHEETFSQDVEYFFSSHGNRNLDHEQSVGADVNVLDGLRLKNLPQNDANTSKLDYSSIMNQSGLSEN